MKTFTEIKKLAFAIKEEIMVVKEGINGIQEKYIPQISGFNNYYNIDNQIISFVKGNIQYVLPFTDEIELVLIKAGFKRTYDLYVPFKNGDYPIENAEEWRRIRLSIF